ncbi:hypothetical protein GCM10028812_13190 [Ancylobacter sonchi]
MTFVGITRFSVVTRDSLGWFRSTRDLTVEEAKQQLFEGSRIKSRLHMFRRFALPSYVAMTKRPRSYALIVINDDLPPYARRRLDEMLAPHPRIRLVTIGRGQSFRSKPRQVSIELAEGGRLYSYRLDDDDALSPAYFDVIAPRLDALADRTVVSAIDGLTIAPEPDEVINLRSCRHKYNAQGMGVVSGPDDYLTAFSLGSHMRVNTRFPVDLVTTGRPVWLRTRHASNDSPGRLGAQPVSLGLPEALVRLKADFPFLNEAAMRALYMPLAASEPEAAAS